MILLRELASRLPDVFGRSERERMLDEEIRAHLDLLAEDYEHRGLSRDEARAAARRQFGGVTQMKEAHRDQRGLRLLDELGQDVRFGLRTLRRSPAFALTVVVTLALGIGVNTAIFSVLDAVLLRSLPVADPGRLFQLSGAGTYSYASFQQLSERARPAMEIFATKNVDRLDLVINGGSPESKPVSFVSGAYFHVLGVPMAVGRTFGAEVDTAIGTSATAVISHGYWQRRFAGDPSVVGRTVLATGQPITIVGVAAPAFFGERVGAMPDLWIPLSMYSSLVPGRDLLRSPTTSWLDLIGRVAPGFDEAHTATALTHNYRRILGGIFGPNVPDDVKRDITATTVTLTPAGKGLSSLRARFSRPLWVLFAIVALILLIACANVANLMLARGAARQRETGLRLALGISRARLIRQLLTEAFLLSSMGASVGLMIAWGGREVLLRMVSPDGSRASLVVGIDTRLLLFVLGASMLTTLLCGLAPAWMSSRRALTPALGSGWPSGRRGRARLGSSLVIGQIAVTVVLLVGAGLFLKTLFNLRQADLGFATQGRLIVDVNPRGAGYSGAAYTALALRLTERLQALPGVASVSISENGALMGRDSSTDHTRPVQMVPGAAGLPRVSFDLVGPRYLSSVGGGLIAGRDFTGDDRPGSALVVVINEQLARMFFGNAKPVGQRLDWDGVVLDVVGLARNMRLRGARTDTRPQFYLPYFQHKDRSDLASARFIVSTTQDPASMAAALRNAVLAEDPKLPQADVVVVESLVDNLLAEERSVAKLATTFGALALGLTAIGLYGLMAYRVAQRTNEIGLRMALGASRGQVIWMVLKSELALIGAGLLAGIPAALAATRMTESILFNVSPTDLATLATAAALMVMVGLMAAIVPTRRASGIEPMAALRHD